MKSLELDAEGDFHLDGAHAEILRDLLALADLYAERIDDVWLEGEGRLLGARIAGHEILALASETGLREPSDWAYVDLLLAVANRAAELSGGALRYVMPKKARDQIAVISCVPSSSPIAAPKPSRSVRFLDGEAGAERLRKHRVLRAIDLLSHHDWQVRRGACSPEVRAALRAGCPATAKLLAKAADSADSFVADWAREAVRSL
jgi:hypothetical protein